MTSDSRRDLIWGVVLMLGFAVVLISLFLPIYQGHTPLNYMDQLYNTISKGSVYYIDQLQVDARKYQGAAVEMTWKAGSTPQAERLVHLLNRSGSRAVLEGTEVRVSGDLGAMLNAILADADAMFRNDGSQVRDRYGLAEKQVLYDWWTFLKTIDRQLTRDKRFEEARFTNVVMTKAVECSFNYYGIEAGNIRAQAYLVIFSLAFYVVYTIWFGYAILFMLKGFGLKLEHH